MNDHPYDSEEQPRRPFLAAFRKVRRETLEAERQVLESELESAKAQPRSKATSEAQARLAAKLRENSTLSWLNENT